MKLEAKDLTFYYGSSKESAVLKNIDFSIEEGEKVALLAPSGFGKTTFALLLSGYLKPNSGSVLLDGKPLPEKGICPVQLILQHPENAVNPRWKLRKVLEESGNMRDDVLSAFGIEREWLDRYPIELSGGELQRFCIARALMSGARFLICDEISTMLDVITQAQIWKVILSETEKRNMGLIVITHNKNLAERVSTRIVDWGEPAADSV